MTKHHYNTDHLTTEEVKAVAQECFLHWQAVSTGTADEDTLYADTEELSEEYSFWATEFERRKGYDGGQPTPEND